MIKFKEEKMKIRGLSNLRDLGGMAVGENKRIKSGKIFRSGHLGSMSNKAKAKFESLNIAHVFDYRDIREVMRHKDFDGNFEYYHVPAVLDNEDNPILPKELIPLLKEIDEDKANALIKTFRDTYKTAPFANLAFKATFDAMDEGDNFLFHCTAGKDRTGLMAMLILKAFGATKEVILDDYMLSNELRKGVNNRLMLKVKIGLRSKLATKVVAEATFCDRDLMEEVIDMIDKKYPDFNDFLKEEYGVTKERLENWKKLYLEDIKD